MQKNNFIPSSSTLYPFFYLDGIETDYHMQKVANSYNYHYPTIAAMVDVSLTHILCSRHRQ